MVILVLSLSKVCGFLPPTTHEYSGKKGMYASWNWGLQSVAYGVIITRLMSLEYRVEDRNDMGELFVDEQVCFYLLTSTCLVSELR